MVNTYDWAWTVNEDEQKEEQFAREGVIVVTSVSAVHLLKQFLNIYIYTRIGTGLVGENQEF